MIPGEYFIADGDIICNAGRTPVTIKVVNTADRPVQIGSHCHFFEVNRKMSFDRAKAFGTRLNIAAGTAVRFEPGEEKEVELVPLAGARKAFGINNLTNGDTTTEADKAAAMAQLEVRHFKNEQR
ncbi:urease subunit beta [Chitinophaga nivalis]|uniref:Urease subunit beta n=1 Tax=Chitinophaga nivalis TaxID=2991709 RepID=A0ABT3IGJ9_9BACT|nr:urease subunit beta [Chitinophaga nivalis]MCW3467272.1 urease subunit beta [Chitinophaga nivalis]MCW3483036.1 urease subunit beta [Chitinophaga nivalis]